MKHAALKEKHIAEEQALVFEALKANQWSLTLASRALGIAVPTLQVMITRLNLSELYAKYGRHAHGRFPARKSKKDAVVDEVQLKARQLAVRKRTQELAATLKK